MPRGEETGTARSGLGNRMAARSHAFAFPVTAARSACRSPNCGQRGDAPVRLLTPTGPNGPGNRTEGGGV